MPRRPVLARLFASVALVSVLALSVAGCKTTGDDLITGSISAPDQPRTEAEWRRSLEVWGAHYRDNPGDANAAIAYARALRATDQHPQAVAVLQQATIRNPNNMQLLGEYGRALAAVGDYNQALDVLTRAHTPDNPDWRILNAQGAVLDQLGRYVEAQQHYAAALRIVPDEPSVLSNLGLSYALTKDLPRAESTLRQAVARPNPPAKARQNLALVVGLQGRFAEAEQIARADLPPDEAAANVAYLKQMLAQRDQWTKKGRRPSMPLYDAGT